MGSPCWSWQIIDPGNTGATLLELADTRAVTVGVGHRRRIYLEAKANSRRLFFWENGGPLRLSSRQIDQGGQGQYFSILCFGVNSTVVLLQFLYYLAAQWQHRGPAIFKDAGSNLTSI